MKTLFRNKPKMCLFQSVNYLNILLLAKNLERLVFASNEVHWFCDLQTISETTVVLMKK
jgi:hypothetical protein